MYNQFNSVHHYILLTCMLQFLTDSFDSLQKVNVFLHCICLPTFPVSMHIAYCICYYFFNCFRMPKVKQAKVTTRRSRRLQESISQQPSSSQPTTSLPAQHLDLHHADNVANLIYERITTRLRQDGYFGMADPSRNGTHATSSQPSDVTMVAPSTDTPTVSTSSAGAPANATSTIAAATLCQLLGESTHPPQPAFDLSDSQLSSLPLAYHVTERVKNQVTTHQYVDLKSLLPGDKGLKYTIKLNEGSDSQPSVHFESNSNASYIRDIEVWSTAFHIFQAIYLQVYPSMAVPLLKYSETIRDLAKRFGFYAAQYYDQTFRQLKQAEPSLPWERVHVELWVKASSTRNSFRNSVYQPTTQSRVTQARSAFQAPTNVPKGFCWSFHRQGVRCFRQQCPYKHLCPNCYTPHPIFTCKKQTTAQSESINSESTPKPSSSDTHKASNPQTLPSRVPPRKN